MKAAALLEGEGFKTTGARTVEGAAKSAAILLEQVQRVWRKIHSPRPSGGFLAKSPGLLRDQIFAKRRDF
jgi:hypothetical protein